MSCNRRKSRRLLAAMVALLYAGSAAAQTSVTVTLRGEVEKECSITGLASSVAFGDLTMTGNQTLNFTLSCNAPYTYTLASTYAALRHSSGPTAPPGFTALMPYSVRIIIPRETTPIDNTCASSTILAGSQTCTFTSSGTEISLNAAAEIRLIWTGLSNLIAGNYSDTLTLTVQATP